VRPVIRESSAITVRTRFFNPDKLPAVPTTAHYRLTDVTNNRVVIDWTEVTPASFVDVFIGASSNAIHRDNVLQQEHAFVVQADRGLDTQFTDEVHYLISNLSGFS
jgi:hypothetical protein